MRRANAVLAGTRRVWALIKRLASYGRFDHDSMLPVYEAIFAMINHTHFGGRLPDIPIRINNWQRASIACTLYNTATLIPFRIDVKDKILRHQSWDFLCDTIKHEACHAYLLLNGIAHTHESPEWLKAMTDYGVWDKQMVMQHMNYPLKFVCNDCQRLWNGLTRGLRCPDCNRRLKYKGRRY